MAKFVAWATEIQETQQTKDFSPRNFPPPKPRAEGSSPSAPAKNMASAFAEAIFFLQVAEKGLNPKGVRSVKKTVRWTVFSDEIRDGHRELCERSARMADA